MASEKSKNYETNRDYENIDRPYNNTMDRSVQSVDNGSVETQPVKSRGGISDLWITNTFRSDNWKPKTVGFSINGTAGYAEFSDVYISGEITATSGVIGGFTIGDTTITGGDLILDSSGEITLGQSIGNLILNTLGIQFKVSGTVNGGLRLFSGSGTPETGAVVRFSVGGYAGGDSTEIDLTSTAADTGNFSKVSGTTDLGKSGTRWDTIYVVTVDESSDVRIKKNIRVLNYGLKEVLKLEPIRYELNNEEKLGFSAQAVSKILPEVTRNCEKDSEIGTASIRKTEMLPVLVNAIKELSAEIEIMKTKLID